ncbi:hypothetical protein SAMN02983004_00628 [Borreliella japonica]|uniref:Uncharacterized protein n=1 Tax=Borreliella japonica TaxID=34095 RepID=A0A1G4PLV2_BORJA|nr:SIMPL domain-containing protein [Borreliella japonica]WKC88844.1 SIMPL domain-containing protein [Borreliella japonica]SCW33266.1 hypothetical protein SAMN02983004_00628 [Borreliella japonica]
MYVYLIVNTIDVRKIKAVEKNIIELYNQGLLIINDGDSRYYFYKINHINSEMLADSIRNVELTVLEFAKHFGFKSGKIKNADQEYFEFFLVDKSFGNQKLLSSKKIKACCNYFLLFRLICIKGN